METRNQLFQASSKAGLMIGAIGIAFFILLYSLNIRPVGMFKPILILIIGMAINIVLLVIYLKKFRTSQEGIISFTNAFLFGLIALITSSIIVTVFNYIFINYFDPEYMKSVLADQRDWMENYLSGKASEDRIASEMEKLDRQAEKIGTISSTLKGLLGNIVFSGIVALIVGAIMKKNPEIFNNSSSGGVI